ncbi:MAG TPA: hypothetical protein VIO64_09470 [Pseudobacteroides sp.]|uniref:hypothetical protein n=1 Tax=Pseudobacteroides sp. TaxID=1968840 RepID=UPI002F923A58
MFAPENLNRILKDVMRSFSSDAPGNNSDKNKKNCQSNGNKINITPSQALVIAGIIGGVLDVDSLLIGKDQRIEILLSGSLKQKTELEKMLDEIGSMPFDEVVKAMLGRL